MKNIDIPLLIAGALFAALLSLFAGCRHLTPEQKAEMEWWRADLKASEDAWRKAEQEYP